MLTQVLLWAVLSLAWNILSGYSGYFSFGHAAFWGLGAYTVALGDDGSRPDAVGHHPVLRASSAPLAGALIGYPTFRLRGHYFALAMLAYPLATLYVFQWLGYQELPLPMKREAPLLYMQFTDPRFYVVLALGLLVLALLISLRVENSRFGMSLIAIKQNEPAAEAAGIDTWRWKMLALMLSGALAAVAGGLYAVVLLVVTPEAVFGMLVSAQALILALFGGVGSMWGPVIGAVVLVPLAEGLNAELGDVLAGHPGRRLRRRDHRDHPVRARGRLLAGARPPRPTRPAGSRRRRRPRRAPRSSPLPRERGATIGRRSAGVARHQHLFRRAAGARRDRPRRSRGRALRHHRPERRRQDDAVQRHQRLSRAAIAARSALPASRSSGCGRARCAGAASAAPFRSCAPSRA